jgi:hypothetical protein
MSTLKKYWWVLAIVAAYFLYTKGYFSGVTTTSATAN